MLRRWRDKPYSTKTATSVLDTLLLEDRDAENGLGTRSGQVTLVTTDALDAHYINITNIQQIYTIKLNCTNIHNTC